MSGRGNGYDKAMIEPFFGTIKSEPNWPVAWQSRQHAENAVARYIDGFDSAVRRHSSLGFESRIAFERKAWGVNERLSTKHGQIHEDGRPYRPTICSRPGPAQRNASRGGGSSAVRVPVMPPMRYRPAGATHSAAHRRS